MAISEFEEKRCESEMEKFMSSHRPPAHLRNEVDLSYRLVNQSIEIFEIRPHWKNTSEKIETPVAKATYVKSQKIWRVYWQRSDLKWHKYEPCPEVKLLEEFLTLVGDDSHSCFFG